MAAEGQVKAPPVLAVYYMKMLGAQAEAKLGKMSEDDIKPMDAAKAQRYLTANVAVQVSEAEYRGQQDRKAQKATATQNAFQALNDGHAVWDVSTYRDVLTAPESGLRIAFERGIPLVNVHMLRDEDGDVLPPDAEIDDILDARELLHPDLRSPFSAHDRSSVMGGGSPYLSNASPMPLSPQHRAAQERIAQNELLAQRPAEFSYDRRDPGALQRSRQASPPASGRSGRASRRASTNTPMDLTPPVTPAPPVSPTAGQAAADAGVQSPKAKLEADQQA